MTTPLLFLAEMAGFALQTAPIAVLCFSPFTSEELRLRRKTIWIIVAILEAVGSLGMAFLSWITYERISFDIVEPLLNLFMLFFMALFAVLYFWVVKASLAAKILPFILLIQYAASLFILNTVLLQTAYHSID